MSLLKDVERNDKPGKLWILKIFLYRKTIYSHVLNMYISPLRFIFLCVA